MKYGIEFEFFVSKDGEIVPAYLATNNLDGNPFLGEIKTRPLNSILDCVFELEKQIYMEKSELERKGFKMEIISMNKFSNQDLVELRKSQKALNLKELKVLEEFSIYPAGKLGKLLKTGEVKASLQVNLSEHKYFTYPEYSKITVDDKYKYESSNVTKQYACLFNYVSIIQKLDKFFLDDILKTNRTKGVYAIKLGEFGDRIEYRSLPNTIDIKNLLKVLKD